MNSEWLRPLEQFLSCRVIYVLPGAYLNSWKPLIGNMNRIDVRHLREPKRDNETRNGITVPLADDYSTYDISGSRRYFLRHYGMTGRVGYHGIPEYPGQLSTSVRTTELFILVSSPPLELTLYYVYNHTIHLAIFWCRQGYRQHPESSLVER